MGGALRVFCKSGGVGGEEWVFLCLCRIGGREFAVLRLEIYAMERVFLELSSGRDAAGVDRHKWRSRMAKFRATVRWFNHAKGYGFQGRDEGADLFIQYSSGLAGGCRSGKEEEGSDCDVSQGEKDA